MGRNPNSQPYNSSSSSTTPLSYADGLVSRVEKKGAGADPIMACNDMASSFFRPNFLLQMQTPNEDEHSSNHYPPPNATLATPQLLPAAPHDYQAVAALLGRRSASGAFSGMEACEEMAAEDDLSDDCSQLGEKKRRLNVEQVKTLEKNFELGNKLEPERKMQLARALGLQPRQIAIWFQNRRARWKTKQLEKDFDVLRKQYEALKLENDSLHSHNKELQAEITVLRGGREISEPINLNKDTEGSCSNRSDNSSDVNLDLHHGGAHRQPPRHLGPSRLCPKMETPAAAPQDEGLCNMFCSLEDQTGFWTAWHEPHSFH